MKDRICWANEFQAFRVDLHYFAKGAKYCLKMPIFF